MSQRKAREGRDDPVDVGGFGQEGKGEKTHWQGESGGKYGAKSSGQARAQKIQGRCPNCGRTGHQSKDCWARPQEQQSQGQSNSPGKGNDVKGKSGKGGGKKGKSKDAGALVWNQQTGSPVASSVASSPQTGTSTTVGAIDTIECTALDLCATTMAQQEVMNRRWPSMWTLELEELCGRLTRTTHARKFPAGRNYKTATYELSG